MATKTSSQTKNIQLAKYSHNASLLLIKFVAGINVSKTCMEKKHKINKILSTNYFGPGKKTTII